MKNLAVDFDNVIHDVNNVEFGRKMGLPIKGTAEALNYLKNKGYTIIVHTIWKGERLKVIEEYMKYFKIPFDEVTNIKPDAEYYIDDKAIKFTTWKDVLEQI